MLSIISAFAVIGVSRYLESSKLKVDKEIVNSLNQATTSYFLLSSTTPIFDDSLEDNEKIQLLFDEGFLTSLPKANTNNATFVWNEELNLWFLSIDGEVASLSPLGSTPQEIVPNLTTEILSYYDENNRYPRTWGDYAYTDLGLDPDDWSNPIGHIIYSPSGSNIYLRPEDGYQFVLENENGDIFILKSSYQWNLIYNTIEDQWYYHRPEEGNIVLFSTLIIEPS
jgi:type II secretory pathway pseudopilin PulG